MRRHRLLLVAVFVVVVPGVVFGTGSFSVASADRTVDVDVASDENAALGLRTESGSGVVGGESFTTLRLVNQFPADVDLRLVSLSTSGSFVTIETSTPTGVGDRSNPLAVRVRCGATPGTRNVEFSIVAEGRDTRVVATRETSVTCHEPEITSVTFAGCGTVRIEADDAIYPLSVTRIVDDPSANGTASSTVTVDEDGPIGGSSGGVLVAIEADGERYENGNGCVPAE